MADVMIEDREDEENICPACGGSGRRGGYVCPDCGGSGRINVDDQNVKDDHPVWPEKTERG